MPGVPVQLVVFVSKLLAAHRREISTRRRTRALGCWRQAVFALAWFRDRPMSPGWAAGSGSLRPPPTVTRGGAIQVLAAQAPGLRKALEQAKQRGLPT